MNLHRGTDIVPPKEHTKSRQTVGIGSGKVVGPITPLPCIFSVFNPLLALFSWMTNYDK